MMSTKIFVRQIISIHAGFIGMQVQSLSEQADHAADF